MAEENKPVELSKETKIDTPIATEAGVVDTKPTEETVAPVEPIAATEETPAETTEVAKETPVETKAEEATPVEEGHLSHKAQGKSFPKNLIPTKEFFFFGSDAVEPKSLSNYQKSEKSSETAHHNLAWASQTGKGLLFIGDKKAPSGVINLSDASEPEVDGSNKFHLTSKGNKHTFKAGSTAERDNWVSQLKLKIAEAKEAVTHITESEGFKSTLESFKPAAPVKEELKAEEVAKTDAAKEEEVAKPEEVKEEAAKEEPKRRSASRKRASFFGFGKKDEKKEEVKKDEAKAEDIKAEETKPEDAPAAEPVAPVVEPVVPVTETEATKTDAVVAPTEAPAAETKPTEEVESPKEKPASKRNSFFGGVFSKKEKKAVENKPAEVKPAETTETAEPAEPAAPVAPAAEPVTSEEAPVIPPVETTTPLAVEVSNPSNVPAENVEVSEPKKEIKEKDVKEKRKSSLPFAFAKREKSPAKATTSEVDEKSGKSPFSKLRDTIRGRTGSKMDEKSAIETPKEESTVKEESEKVEPATEEASTSKPVMGEESKTAETAEIKPESAAASAPVVTATA